MVWTLLLLAACVVLFFLDIRADLLKEIAQAQRDPNSPVNKDYIPPPF